MIRPRTDLQKRILEHLATLPLDERSRAYVDRRGLAGVAERLRFGTVPAQPARNLQQFAGRLVIPSIAPDGNVYDVAFRCLEHEDCKAVDCPKYLFLPKMPKRLYNTRALAEADDVIDLTEGQLDAASLEACGLHALGSPGASSWRAYYRRMFQDFARIRLWPDGDESGRKWAAAVTDTLPQAEVMMVPSGQDVNTILTEQGPDGIHRIAHGDTDSDDEAAGWGLSPATETEPVADWPYDSEPAPF